MKFLLIHGVGNPEAGKNWRTDLIDPLASLFVGIDPMGAHQFECFAYDQRFKQAPLNVFTYGAALAKLGGGLIAQGTEDLFNQPRGLFDGFTSGVRWTVGMVAQWSVDEKLRSRLMADLAKKIDAFQPDVIVAHSLGTLISYDLFSEAVPVVKGSKRAGRDYIKNRTYVTLGSQIQNPAVRSIFGGKLNHLDASSFWCNLYNPNDNVLTRRITLQYPRFMEVFAEFDEPGPLNHSWPLYVRHAAAVEQFWRPILSARALAGVPLTAAGRPSVPAEPSVTKTAEALETPTRRALLIGINDYPDPRNRLEGCVNDVFEMSATLQECGTRAEDIRVVLNERATAAGIRERLKWLLSGIEDGDERILYYSGHGTQLPVYDGSGKVTSVVESLVPHDFDGKLEHCITDADLIDFYSNLPYGARLILIFDCCHSGGLMKEEGQRVRAIQLSDDIRHRMLRWDIKDRVWVQRDFTPLIEDLSGKDQEQYTGKSGAVYKLGRSVAARGRTKSEYDETRRRKGNLGPYLPTIITASNEDQYSYEYRHGVTSYGAFTYALTHILRRQRDAGRNPTISGLMSDVSGMLKRLRYQQTPQLTGPKAITGSRLPWLKPPAKVKPKR